MAVDAHYIDPRMVALYELTSPFADDTRFYLGLAKSLRAERGLSEPFRVLDMGCGTGILTDALAGQGHTVTGVDPAGGRDVGCRA